MTVKQNRSGTGKTAAFSSIRTAVARSCCSCLREATELKPMAQHIVAREMQSQPMWLQLLCNTCACTHEVTAAEPKGLSRGGRPEQNASAP